jgi:putative peptidoglycan lipid II flippase
MSTRTVVKAAVVVAVITVVARVVGFGRWLVFSKTVGAGCLAEAYATANQLPNVLFEVVVGGALAGAVIPVLAGPVARGDREAQGRIVGALLAWSVVLLVPVAVAAWVLADRYTQSMLDADCNNTVGTAARMLVIFVPQVFGYAVAVIATAVLQSHHRFVAGAVAPLVSSAVVIATYVLFARQAPSADRASQDAVDLLAWGTTFGVAALALTVLVPMLTLRIPVRVTLKLDPGVGKVLRRLAVAGLAVLVAQQVSFLVTTYLANHRGTAGSIAVYTWANAVYLLPYAVLAVPITTAVFPRLSAAYESRDLAAYDRLAATSTRAVVLAACGGAAMLIGTAVPVARVFGYDDGRVQETQAAAMADGLVAFAPALIGFAVLMHAGRLLYARQAGWRVAVVTVAAWLGVVVAGIAATARWDGPGVVGALAGAMSVGMVAGGIVLVVALRRVTSLDGLGRAVVSGVAAAAVAGVAGWVVASPSADGGWAESVLFAGLSGVVIVAVYALAVWLLDRRDARMLLHLRRRTFTE